MSCDELSSNALSSTTVVFASSFLYIQVTLFILAALHTGQCDRIAVTF